MSLVRARQAHKLTVPVMSPEDVAACTVAHDDVVAEPARLTSLLDREGFAVVEGVTSPEECAALEALWARALRCSLDPRAVRDADPHVAAAVAAAVADPLSADNLPHRGIPGQQSTGFVPKLGLPHSEFSWRVRTNAKIRHLYSHLMGVPADDLCVGLDLLFFSPKGLPGVMSTQFSAHSDQNKHVDGSGEWPVYQGVL